MERIRKDRGSRDSANPAAQRKSPRPLQGGLASQIDDSPVMAAQRRKLQSLFGGAAQLREESRPNNTGLPDNLKSGIENLSGMSMDHVKVHYNSSLPAQLNALAYAQGSDIHVAPGQEQHLPHEVWHVVQQAQGRVKPTMQMKGGVAVNHDSGLEREADAMGAKALQSVMREGGGLGMTETRKTGANPVIQKLKLTAERLNVAGEDHDESNKSKRRELEWRYATDVAKGQYWEEREFSYGTEYGDLPPLRALYVLKRTARYYGDFYDDFLDQPVEREALNKDFAKLQKLLSPKALQDEMRETKNGQWLQILSEYRDKDKQIKEAFEAMGEDTAKLEDAVWAMMEFARDTGNLFSSASMDEVRVMRSRRMHAIANEATEGGKRGVWKIGDQHVQDMKDEGLICTFNLLSRDEFEEGFSEYCREQEEIKKERERIEKERIKKKKRRRSVHQQTLGRQILDRETPEKKKRKPN